ncbi:MAG TPA: penicillin-binding protein 2 [Firmicutes bacterium]|nr:penicillin-binding protein 2 [Bacillota bacterium]
MSAKKHELRLRNLEVITILIFLFLSARLWQIQIISGDRYATLSEGNRLRIVRVRAPRGMILDRRGVPLASSRMAYCISVVPQELDKEGKSLERLAKILGMKKSELDEKIAASYARPFEPVRLVVDADPRLVTTVEERRLDLPGVIVEELPVRHYPFGEFASHLIGYIGEIAPAELEDLSEKGYRPGDIVGKTGIEKTWEVYLHGKDGGQQVEVNSLGRPIRVLGNRDPVPGDSVILTIDAKLQAAAESALAEELDKLSKNPETKNARAGAVVAVDPRTGEILAMASRPGFDPNDFVQGLSREKWKELNNPTNPLANRVTMFAYPPGSTFKVITATAALEEGKVTPQDRFECRGRDPISKKACWILSKGRGHGVQDLAGGIKNSCNIVFYELGRRVGIDALAKWARLYGLGAPTGIKLDPGERSGLVPDREWKSRNFKGADRNWYPDETLDVAIGQGALSATPIQLAMAYCALANGGWIYEPSVVLRVKEPGGRTLWEFMPRVRGHVPISPAARAAIVEGMKAVTGPGGTAAGSFAGFPVPVAGKTGTAQAPPGDSHAWFAAFAPADNPEIVVLTFVERGTSGSLAAAPIARRVLDAYFGTGSRAGFSKPLRNLLDAGGRP